MTLDKAAESGAPATTPGAAGTDTQPDYQALYQELLQRNEELEKTDWYKRFTGLQASYQREKTTWQDTKALSDSLRQENETLRTQTSELETKHNSVAEQLQALQGELDIERAAANRMRIITTEFPHLLSFLGGTNEDGSPAEDLLPDGTGDELRSKLKAFDARIKTFGPSNVPEKSREGASPKMPVPERSTPESLLAQAIDALRKGDTQAYDQLYAQHLESLKK